MRARIILLAEESTLRRSLRILLAANAYVVDTVVTFEDMLGTVAVTASDLVVYAPAVDMIEAVARLRAATIAPLIVLTSRPGGAIAQALGAGADDAIAPPHAREEILARLAIALRRPRAVAVRMLLRWGDVAIDVESRQARVGQRRLTLTRLEYRLLEALVLAQGHAVPHDVLLAQVWGPANQGRLHYLRVYVARLRRKIEDEGAPPRIVSVAGVGYGLAGGPSDDGDAQVDAQDE